MVTTRMSTGWGGILVADLCLHSYAIFMTIAVSGADGCANGSAKDGAFPATDFVANGRTDTGTDSSIEGGVVSLGGSGERECYKKGKCTKFHCCLVSTCFMCA